jgi:hypothetical protein
MHLPSEQLHKAKCCFVSAVSQQQDGHAPCPPPYLQGIAMQPQVATELQEAVAQGEWEVALSLLPRLAPRDEDARQARFLILRQVCQTIANSMHTFSSS